MDYFKNLGKDYKPWTFAAIPVVITMILAYIYPHYYTCEGVIVLAPYKDIDYKEGCDEAALESLGFNILFLGVYYACTVGILSYYYKNEKAVYVAIPSTITLALLYGVFYYYETEWGMASHPPIYILAYLLSVLTINYVVVYE